MATVTAVTAATPNAPKTQKEKKPNSVLVVGARKFTFTPEVQCAGRVGWWDSIKPTGRGDIEIVPDRLEKVYAKSGLARNKELALLAGQRNAAFIEFTDETDLLPLLNSFLNILPAGSGTGGGKGATAGNNGKSGSNGSSNGVGGSCSTEEILADIKKDEESETIMLGDLELESDRILQIPCREIVPNPDQPRKKFRRILSLGKCLQISGQNQPVILLLLTDELRKRLKDHDPNHKYMLFDGERRWRGAKDAGKATLTAIIAKSMSDAELLKRSAIVNLQRQGHEPMEIARVLKTIREEDGVSVRQLAEQFGYESLWATQHLNLLKLHPEVQKLIDSDLADEGKGITFSVAVEVCKVAYDHQLRAARHILDNKLTLNQARHYIRHLIAAVGAASKLRTRKPDDDFKILNTFIRRSTEQVGQLRNLPGGWTIQTLFSSRPWTVADAKAKELTALIKGLTEIRDAVAEVARKR